MQIVVCVYMLACDRVYPGIGSSAPTTMKSISGRKWVDEVWVTDDLSLTGLTESY